MIKGGVEGTSYYKKGYKYRSVGDDSIDMSEWVEDYILLGRGYPGRKNWNEKRKLWYSGRCIEISPQGILTVRDSYSWDGCSGPVVDRESNHKAGMFHDALYECIRNGLLDEETWRPIADMIFKNLCIAKGVYEWLANIEYWFVKTFGYKYATTPKKIYEAH